MIRCTHTLKNEQRDFVEWHRGRAPYVLWAIDVDLAEVRQRVSLAMASMADLLLDGYQRQPHVTLALCGFPTMGVVGEDEFSERCLGRQVAALRQALDGVQSFALEIGKLATFESAPYLAVDDAGGAIAAINAALALVERAGQGGEGAQDGGMPHVYVPHVTVGLYRDTWPLDAVRERIARFANPDPLIVRVDRIRLLAYDPREIGGPLSALGEFSLGRGEFQRCFDCF